MAGNHSDLEKRLWDAADELRANSKLKSSEYSVPVLGLIFLRFADNKFAGVEKELAAQSGERRRTISKTDYLARGVYLPESARFKRLLELPEGANIGKEINDAMKAIEDDNPDLKGVLPRTYNRLENSTLVELLKTMNRIPADMEGDAFGKIYEYFLGKFSMSEGQKGGEFFTPTSVVKLIVAILEPFHGKILDQACGSGGMFVQSAEFVKEHQRQTTELSIYGQEKTAETVRLCKMNLAVYGLDGDNVLCRSVPSEMRSCVSAHLRFVLRRGAECLFGGLASEAEIEPKRVIRPLRENEKAPEFPGLFFGAERLGAVPPRGFEPLYRD
ncbi:MAG: SAM-dependent DNA methyltransferase [Planctomycetaceae bacterium]|nr:SAM-dependent DNA methyltransferase [Planctomycetaceae bacterium]